MEIARDKGKATGNVSTAEITDATPAGPSSHISQRGCQGPADTRTTCPSEAKTAATPGLGSIAEQQVDEGFDVYLGGGRARYLQTLTAAGPTTVVDYAQSNGYTVVSDKAGMDAFTSLAGGAKLLGLFHASNMTTEFAPLHRLDHGSGLATTRCVETNRPATEPSLSAMTRKAIALLDDDPDGFTLQVEGASIDKRDHAADICGQIGETLEFDNAIAEALDFQADNPDTLIIVTADHAHTSQIINSGQVPATGASYGTRADARRRADPRDATARRTRGGSQAHTGAQVPVWASGPQAANIQGTIDQTDIFAVLNGLIPSTLRHRDGRPARRVPRARRTPGAAGRRRRPGRRRGEQRGAGEQRSVREQRRARWRRHHRAATVRPARQRRAWARTARPARTARTAATAARHLPGDPCGPQRGLHGARTRGPRRRRRRVWCAAAARSLAAGCCAAGSRSRSGASWPRRPTRSSPPVATRASSSAEASEADAAGARPGRPPLLAGSDRDSTPAASTRSAEAHRQASSPCHWYSGAGEDRAGEPPAGVGHVVEADVHRDLVAVGVGEDEVAVHRRVQREHDAERDQADDDRDRVASAPAASAIAMPAGNAASANASHVGGAPVGVAARSAARTPARCRSR